MRLKGKLFIFVFALFVFFSLCVWSYSEIIFDKVNEKWAERFVKKQVLFDKNRTLIPVLHELEIIQELAKEPDIIAMALDDENPDKRAKGLAIFEQYREKYQVHSYFAAFVKSENYYFNDSKNKYAGRQFQYKLSSFSINDSWFYNILSDNQAYKLNVDTDEVLGRTYVWINVDLRHNDKVIGVIGTGLDFTKFVRESVGIEQEGVRNFFINRHLDIQLERDVTLPQYKNLAQADGTHKKLNALFLHKQDLEAIQKNLEYLRHHPDDIRTLWVDYDGSTKMLAMSYLKEVEWFSLTLIDASELSVMKDFSIFPMLSFLFFVAFIAVGIELHTLVLNPLNRLKVIMQKIEHGHYEIDLRPIGTAEIEDLSKQFIKMIEYVRANNQALEMKIQERTQGLMQSEEKLNTILDTVDAFIYIKDTSFRYVYANKSACEHVGLPLSEIIGQTDELFFDEHTTQRIRKVDAEVIELGRKVTSEEYFVLRKTATIITCISTKIPLYNEKGEIYGLCGISTDITERKRNEELIKELAFKDTLTGLPNRRMFHNQFATLLAYAKRHNSYGALLVLDLDNFKPLNDKYGHSAGDLLLIEVAKRLQACVRSVDIVARFGGDEFLVALGDIGLNEESATAEALKIAEKIGLHIKAPYVIVLDSDDGSKIITHECSASIGISLFNAHKQKEEDIFSEADKAMYDAKNNGRNRVELYKEQS